MHSCLCNEISTNAQNNGGGVPEVFRLMKAFMYQEGSILPKFETGVPPFKAPHLPYAASPGCSFISYTFHNKLLKDEIISSSCIKKCKRDFCYDMVCIHVYLYVEECCVHISAGAHGDQKRVSEPVKVEVQVNVRCPA